MRSQVDQLRLTLHTKPAVLPVTLNEARKHLRIEDDVTAEDPTLASNLISATNAAEQFLGRALVTQTWTAFRDAWPVTARGGNDEWWDGTRQGSITSLFGAARGLALPKPPLQSISLINTYDDDDVATLYAASNYFVDTSSEPGRIVLRDSASLPAPTRVANGLEIRFVAGYGGAYADVPEDIREGIRRFVAYMYENRGECTEDQARDTSGARVLWAPYRMVTL